MTVFEPRAYRSAKWATTTARETIFYLPYGVVFVVQFADHLSWRAWVRIHSSVVNISTKILQPRFSIISCSLFENIFTYLPGNRCVVCMDYIIDYTWSIYSLSLVRTMASESRRSVDSFINLRRWFHDNLFYKLDGLHWRELEQWMLHWLKEGKPWVHLTIKILTMPIVNRLYKDVLIKSLL